MQLQDYTIEIELNSQINKVPHSDDLSPDPPPYAHEGNMDQQKDHWRFECQEHLLCRWHSVHENIKTTEPPSNTESQSWLVEVIILTKNSTQPKLDLDQEMQVQVHQLKSQFLFDIRWRAAFIYKRKNTYFCVCFQVNSWCRCCLLVVMLCKKTSQKK